MISFELEDKLKNLGGRLRDKRLQRDESQKIFAVRINVSVPTLRKMEAGNPNVAIGTWVKALDILDRLSDIDLILKDEMNLFEIREYMEKKKRKRASKKIH